MLPFRPQSTGGARFAKFCQRFVKVPKGTGGKPLYVRVIASEMLRAAVADSSERRNAEAMWRLRCELCGRRGVA